MIRNGSTWVFSPPFVNFGSRVIYHGWTMDLRGMYTTEKAKRRPKHEKDRFMRRFVKQREEIGGEKTSMGLLWWWWWARVADVKLHTYRACTMCVYVMNKNTHTHTHTMISALLLVEWAPHFKESPRDLSTFWQGFPTGDLSTTKREGMLDENDQSRLCLVCLSA